MADTTPATPPPPAPAAVASSPTASPTKKKPAAHFQDADGLFQTVCRAFMAKKCQKTDCKHVHDAQLCRLYWKSGECKFGKDCKRNHFVTVGGSATPTAVQTDAGQTDAANKPTDTQKKKKNKDKKDKKPTATATTDATEPTNAKKPQQQPKDKSSSKPKVRTVKGKNTECFEPMTTPVDVRITYDLGTHRDAFSTSLTTRDVLLAPNIFSDFKKGELYATLVKELEHCGIPEERLLKMWHGNEKLDGTHLIADDKTRWKQNCPTFQLVIDRLQKFFQLNVQATRFNWYRDTSQWKPFHFDAAAVKPEIAAKQNFTVAVSFGATRDAAFEHAKTRTVVSVPQPDGCVYAFARDTNIIWRHGILQDVPVRQEGRISVIAWGWIDGMVDTTEPTA